MSYSKGDFYKFLTAFRVEKGAEFTHTSISKPSGSFYIPSDNIDEFYDMYSKALDNGEELYLTERHRPISPFLIDLDFRFEKTLRIERKYTLDQVKSILATYIKYISEYVKLPTGCRAYVMEKSSPVVDKELIKDGIHIILPDIITKPEIQFIVRKKVLKDLQETLKDIGLKNTIEDVVDEAVIHRNNWQMCGSKKPNCEAYKVTRIYRCADMIEETVDSSTCDLVTTLSIRNKYDETPTKIEKQKEVEEYAKEHSKKMNKFDMKTNPVLQTNQNNKKNTIDNLEFVEKLVDLLSVNRADAYMDWIKVGWCLRNIDYRLMPKWISFSQKSTKYAEGECERLWNYMKDDGLGIGTLHMWAKADDEVKYAELCKKDLGNLIYRSTSETHTDIARVVHFMYRYQYVCVSIKLNLWYEYRGHKWVLCDSGHTLRSKVSNEVVREYYRQAAYYNEQATREDAEADQQRWGEMAKKLNTIALKLKQSAFKDNIMKECKELFFIEKFEEKLDSRCHLIGFENGIFDLETYEFRDGRPEDYISFSTGINYIPCIGDSENSRGMMKFVDTIFTKPHVRDYVLTLLSSFLNGNVREEKFHIWTGVGSNGKSKFIELFESSFGDYCCKFPITLLTGKRAASNAATSELARAKGKRFGALQEPSEDEKLNIGLMKELSGGDKIQARLIYKEPIEFKPQFKMILACNHLPAVPSDDGGTWRRIRALEFTSRFCEHPDPNKPNEFPIDKELSSKFPEWKEHFMSMLITYYKRYVERGIVEPDEVLECTKEYQRANDGFLDYVEQELEKQEYSFISHGDVYTCFKMWMGDNAPPHFKGIKKKEFVKAVEKIIGKSVQINKINGWKGWGFKSNSADANDDLEG